jgi:hypothetical protein
VGVNRKKFGCPRSKLANVSVDNVMRIWMLSAEGGKGPCSTSGTLDTVFCACVVAMMVEDVSDKRHGSNFLSVSRLPSEPS